MSYSGLTINFCKKVKAGFIIRGLRNANDFEFEQSVAQMNYSLSNKIETVFIPCLPEFSAISSSIVRDILRHGGDIKMFVPETVLMKI